MPLPKALQAKLTALLKEGATLPDELEEIVAFSNPGEFNAEIERKTKGKLTEADKKAQQQAKEAREAAVAEFCEKYGIKDPDEIAEVKAKLAAAEGTLSEAEKLKGEHAKTAKELQKALKENESLLGFKLTVTKERALDPHLAKVHADFRDLVRENLLSKLTVDGDKITGPEGKAIDVYVDELIKAKPSLKAPDHKGGAGTGPNGGKADPAAGNGATGGDGGAGGANGVTGGRKPETIREALAIAFADQAKAQGVGP